MKKKANIKELVNKRGYTIMMLADRMSVSRITMSKYVNNIYDMPLSKFVLLCDILNYSMKEVIENSEYAC